MDCVTVGFSLCRLFIHIITTKGEGRVWVRHRWTNDVVVPAEKLPQLVTSLNEAYAPNDWLRVVMGDYYSQFCFESGEKTGHPMSLKLCGEVDGM